MSQSKLMVNNHEAKPSKKVKLYEKVGHRMVKQVLEDPEKLDSLRQRLQEQQEKGG